MTSLLPRPVLALVMLIGICRLHPACGAADAAAPVAVAPAADCPAASAADPAQAEPRRPGATPDGSDPGTPGRRTREARRYLSATDAARLAQAPATVLVDLRRPEEFAALHVPGSLNIPAPQVKTKGFLRGKRVILLDDGHRYRTAEDLAAELEGLGFSGVGIVEGGLAAWQQEVGAAAGTAAPGRLRAVTPGDYLAERVYDHWRVVRIGAAAETPGDRDPLPAERTLPSGADPAKLREQLAELARPPADGLRPLVLVATTGGEDQARVQAAMQGGAPWNLLVLEGGTEGYAKAAAALRAMWNRDPRPTGAGGSCGRR